MINKVMFYLDLPSLHSIQIFHQENVLCEVYLTHSPATSLFCFSQPSYSHETQQRTWNYAILSWIWDLSVSNFCQKIPIDLIKTFLELHCSRQIFLSTLFFSLSFKRYQICIKIQKFSVFSLPLYLSQLFLLNKLCISHPTLMSSWRIQSGTDGAKSGLGKQAVIQYLRLASQLSRNTKCGVEGGTWIFPGSE